MGDADRYLRCTSCRTDIFFGSVYWVCSVSTCNRPRTGLAFCSLACWDAHLPEARHREAWAEERRAPSREAAQAADQETAAPASAPRRVVVAPPAAAPAPASASDVPREVLVVVSKLKAYIRARTGLNTSDGVVDAISDHLRRLCDQAARHAAADGRKTVMDRDFLPFVRDD